MPHKKKKFRLSKEKKEILNDFLEYKKGEGVSSPSKLDHYRYFMSMFLSSTNKKIKDLTEKDLINFINTISKNYSIGSMNSIKPSLKLFIKWFYVDYSKRFRHLDKICADLRKEPTYSPSQMITKEDIELLVQNEHELRWKAFWLLYFYGGFRPKEVCELKWEKVSFDIEGAFIETHVTKTKRIFHKYVPENVCFYLKKLNQQSSDSKYIFPTKRTTKRGIPVGDKPMTSSGVYQRLIPLARRVLNKHINPYILRHSIATILYNRDDLKDDNVAHQMGHNKEMRETYNNLSKERLKEKAKKIWIKSEDLPEEKKHELLLRLEKLEKENKEMQPYYLEVKKWKEGVRNEAKQLLEEVKKEFLLKLKVK